MTTRKVYVDVTGMQFPHYTIFVTNAQKPHMDFVGFVKQNASDKEIRKYINSTYTRFGKVSSKDKVIRQDRNWVEGYGWQWQDVDCCP